MSLNNIPAKQKLHLSVNRSRLGETEHPKITAPNAGTTQKIPQFGSVLQAGEHLPRYKI